MAILELKYAIEKIFNIPPEGQQLRQDNRVFQNNDLISTLVLSSMDTIKLEELPFVIVILKICNHTDADVLSNSSIINLKFYLETPMIKIKCFLSNKLNLPIDIIEIKYKDSILADNQILREFPCAVPLQLDIYFRHHKLIIGLKSIGARKHWYVVADSTNVTVADIIPVAAKCFNILPHMQNIIWRGSCVDFDKTLHELKISSNDIFHIC